MCDNSLATNVEHPIPSPKNYATVGVKVIELIENDQILEHLCGFPRDLDNTGGEE